MLQLIRNIYNCQLGNYKRESKYFQFRQSAQYGYKKNFTVRRHAKNLSDTN